MSAVDPASDPVVALTRQLAESRQLPGSSSDVQTILSGVLRIADGLLVPAASVVAYWVWHDHSGQICTRFQRKLQT